MPEFVNMSVGSLPGTSELEGTTVWPLEAKKSRKVLRMSATVNVGWLIFGFRLLSGAAWRWRPCVETTALNRPNCLICLNNRL
ncbi:hypothetical protein D9M69_561920 [compost metagenome]